MHFRLRCEVPGLASGCKRICLSVAVKELSNLLTPSLSPVAYNRGTGKRQFSTFSRSCSGSWTIWELIFPWWTTSRLLIALHRAMLSQRFFARHKLKNLESGCLKTLADPSSKLDTRRCLARQTHVLACPVFVGQHFTWND